MNKWTKQREIVFKDRYAMKDENGNLIETSPEQMWERIAGKRVRYNQSPRALEHDLRVSLEMR